MQARLLWKDLRQFGPAWVVLALAGLGGFGLAIYYAETAEARSVALWIVALGCTCLYALAVGSAALAGEREGGTMGWLDTLPVPRRVLWGSKAVFGVASTLVLAVVLFGVAAMRLELGEVPGSENVGRLGVILGVVVVLLEGVGWGLVWSAMLSNVVAAAALAVLCFLSLTASPGLDPRGLAEEWPVRLMLAVVTGGVSLWVFTRVGPPRREWSLRGGRRRRAAVGVGDSTGAAEIIKPRRGDAADAAAGVAGVAAGSRHGLASDRDRPDFSQCLESVSILDEPLWQRWSGAGRGGEHSCGLDRGADALRR